jgi:hypothetical protein
MSDPEVDTERVMVQTYVPRYQRDEWDAHAEELDMSRSEFVRTMVQAGRRGFSDGDESSDTDDGGSGDAGGGDSTSGVAADLESQVLDALSAESYMSWEELLAAVTAGIEEELEETLQALQSADRVRYSGRNGGYTVDE